MVKQATLQMAELASRTAHKHLHLVMTALDAKRDKLLEEVAAKKTAANEAAAAVTTTQAAVDALESKMQTAATAQVAVQSKLAALKAEYAQLQATAAATPCTGKVTLQLAATHLPDTDFGIRNKTDPIYEIFAGQGYPNKALRSNKVEDDLNPVWDALTVDLGALGGSMDAKIKIVVSDKDGGKDQTALGSVELTVNQLVAMQADKSSVALPPTKTGRLLVKQALVQDLVDHQKAAQEYYKASIEPVANECTTVTQAFEAARTEMDAARAAAAAAQEAAQKAADAAEAAHLALELMEKSG